MSMLPRRRRRDRSSDWGLAGERPHEELPRGGARASAWMAVGALVIGLAATPFGVDLGRTDFGRLVEGSLQLHRDGAWTELEVPTHVPAGAEVRASSGDARIEVEGGLLTLAEGAQLHAVPASPQVHRGSLLVEADAPLEVRVGATTAEGRGDWRVDVGVASRVATYRARVELDDGATQREVDRFRQVSVRDGAVDPGLRPLRYAGDDVWDEWLLADALAVDRLAARLRGALERGYGESVRSADFYAAFAAVEGAGLTDLGELAGSVENGRFGPPADVLLAVAVIDALSEDAGLTTAEAHDRLVNLRRAGGTWGLVLVEHDLGAAALRAAAERALRRVEDAPPSEVEPDEPPADEAQGPEGTDEEISPAEADDGTAPGAGPDGDRDAGTDPEPAPEPPPPPGDDREEPEDAQGPLEPVGDAVRDTGSTAGQLLEDTTGTVGDLLEGTTESLGDAVGSLGSGLGSSARSAPTSSDESQEPEAAEEEGGAGLLGR